MPASSPPVVAFTVVAYAALGIALWWGLKDSKKRWFHLLVLGLAIVFWWIGESLGLRLGKYEYAEFPLVLPFGGPLNKSDLAYRGLRRLMAWMGETAIEGCTAGQKSWNIPSSVVAIEAALVFTMFRISVLLFKREGWLTALASGGLSALLMTNVTAVLDPVVSTTQWCGTAKNPEYHGLSLGLWQWFTNEQHTGYWFGVPLVNYFAWLLAAATFTLTTRWFERYLEASVRPRRFQLLHVAAILVAVTAAYFVILIPAKIGVDLLLSHVHDGGPVWQSFLVVLLLAVSLGLVILARARQNPELKWILWAPQLFVLAFCLVAIVQQRDLRIFLVLLATIVVAIAVMSYPWIAKSIEKKGPPKPENATIIHG